MFSYTSLRSGGTSTAFILLTLVLQLTSAKVLELDDSILDLLDKGPWLINFYAPWCGYCRRLEPTYEKIGQFFASIDSPIKIARIDATVYSKVGRFFQVDGFPTIKFVDRDRLFTYNGDRSPQSIIAFGLRANGPAVKTLESVSAFEGNASLIQSDTFFVLVNHRDPLLRNAFEKLAEEYRLLMWFFSVPSTNAIPKKYAHLVEQAEQANRGVIAFKDGDGLVFEHPTNAPEPQSVSAVEGRLRHWLLRERCPIFMETRVADLWEIGATEMILLQSASFTPSSEVDKNNQRETSDPVETKNVFPYRLIALFLLNPPQTNDAVSKEFKEFGENLARKRIPELFKRYQFAWTDQSLDVLSNLAMVSLTAPSLIVVDPVTRVIYLNPNQTTVNGLFSLEQKVVYSYLLAVLDGRVPGHGGNTIGIRLRRLGYNFVTGLMDFVRTSPIIALLIFGIPTMFLGCVGYLCCCLDEQYDETEFDDHAATPKHTHQSETVDTRECSKEDEVGTVKRRRSAPSSKHSTKEVTALGPVVSREEIESRRAAYQEWKRSK